MARFPTPDEVMSSEIKQDIAQRYFGFRKLIEEDKLDLDEKVRQYSFILEKRISFDLIRIYVLLREERLIKAFLDLIDLGEELFYDPYLTESENIARRVLSCQEFRGWSRAARFRNFICDCYEKLTFHAAAYRSKVEELEQKQGLIQEEIRQFYRKNDISTILHFVHSLGDPQVAGDMQGGLEIGLAEELAGKMQIKPPLPIERLMLVLPPLKPLAAIKDKLKKLIVQAYKVQPAWILELFGRRHPPCERREAGEGQ
jgi:hypothetical protein